MFGLNLQVITSIPRWGLSRQSRRCSIPPRFAASESSEKAESEPTGRTRPEGPAKRPATKVEKGSQKKRVRRQNKKTREMPMLSMIPLVVVMMMMMMMTTIYMVLAPKEIHLHSQPHEDQ